MDSQIIPIRDFEKNLLWCGAERRLEMALQRYEDADEEENKYHFGSHYSNPGVVIMYLIWTCPFLDADL